MLEINFNFYHPPLSAQIIGLSSDMFMLNVKFLISWQNLQINLNEYSLNSFCSLCK